MTAWSCKRLVWGVPTALATLWFLVDNWFRSLSWQISQWCRAKDRKNSSLFDPNDHGHDHDDDKGSHHGLLPFVLVEKYRKGPQQQNEWNLMLWRISFPLFALLLLTLFALVGQWGRAAYAWTVCSGWYFCSFCVVAYPFCLIYHFPDLQGRRLTRLWKILAVISVVISVVEWLVANLASSRSSRHQRRGQTSGSMITGNTLFGTIAFVALPWFFHKLSRVVRDTHEITHDDQAMETTFPSLPLTDLGKSNVQTRSPASSHSVHQRRDQSSSSCLGSRLALLSGSCLGFVWVIMVLTYSSYSWRPKRKNSMTEWWMFLEMLSPGLVAALYLTQKARGDRFRFDYLVAYSVLVIHIPIFVGQLCLRLFTLMEASDLASAGVTGAFATKAANGGANSWLKLSVSVVYLVSMQSYFYVLLGVVNTLCEPFAYPSLLYMGQLYYYLFWYMLVGSDTPIDLVYWAMLFANNVHIALLNTGVYSDVRRAPSSHFHCVSKPVRTTLMQMQWRFQVASRHSMLCVRATAACTNPMASQFHDSPSTMTMLNSSSPSMASSSPMFDASPSPFPVDDSLPSLQTSAPRSLCSTDDCGTSSIGACCSKNQSNPSSTPVTPLPSKENLKALYFLMKVAEQDNMADTTALILVPSLITLLALLEKPSSGFGVFAEQFNLWIRCTLMFFGRMFGAYLAREIFTFKLKRFWRQSGMQHLAQADEMKAARLWIQRVMLTDFHRQFWYLMAVTITVVFACFEHVDLPFRFALLV